MVKALTSQPRMVRLILGLLALLFAASAISVGMAQPARAAETPTPTPTSSAPAAAESIGIWVRLLTDKTNVPDVAFTVTGDGGFTQTVTTGKDGRVEVPLPGPGTYKVQVDLKTMPKDGLSPLGTMPREVTVPTDNTDVPAYFLLSTQGGSIVPSPGTSATPSPGSNSGSNSNSSSGGFSITWDDIAPRIATGLIFGLLLALASVGVSLIYGTTGLNNFAHGELVTFGALVGYTVSGILHLPGWVGILTALVLGGAFGWIQDVGLWKPLRKRGVALIPLMIVSIGLSLAVRYIYEFIYGPDILVTPSDSSAFLTLGPVHLRSADVTSPIICIVVLLGVAFVLLRTRIGKATRAVADNRSLAAASGINVERVIRVVWVGGGALAGLSGALIGYYQPVSWQTGASILLLIFAAVTLGGLGTAFGALVGSVVIGLLVDLSTLFIPSNMKLVAALLVMIIILLFRPQGILGRRDRIG